MTQRNKENEEFETIELLPTLYSAKYDNERILVLILNGNSRECEVMATAGKHSYKTITLPTKDIDFDYKINKKS